MEQCKGWPLSCDLIRESVSAQRNRCHYCCAPASCGAFPLPDAWRARYQADLGVVARDDKNGVLQDVHWFSGPIGGAFQGYTLGNILSAQFFDAALQAHPEIEEHIKTGRFDLLHSWLQENIYQHGSRYTTHELVERVTGGPISVQSLLAYLRTKYGQVYALQGKSKTE